MILHEDPTVRIIRAPNPSALTGTGTNTYLLGRGDVAVIDPGPQIDSHLAAIRAALGPYERVTHIIVTHPHLDHSALAPRLSALCDAPVAAFGSATDGRSAIMTALAGTGLPDGGELLDRSFSPDIRLGDGDVVSGTGWSLRALHTPGHLGAHLCFAANDVLFTGDHVMGWSTSLVAPPDGDMTDYMASLHKLASHRARRMFPGHGDPIEAPSERVAALIAHREEREAQIVAALHDGPANARTLATRIYTGIAPNLLKAASANVLAHLVDLLGKGTISTQTPLTPDSRFETI